MDLTNLSKTDKQLLVESIEQSRSGKLARQEIRRRKLVGYCDGTAIEKVDSKQPTEIESRVGVVYINGVQQ